MIKKNIKVDLTACNAWILLCKRTLPHQFETQGQFSGGRLYGGGFKEAGWFIGDRNIFELMIRAVLNKPNKFKLVLYCSVAYDQSDFRIL